MMGSYFTHDLIIHLIIFQALILLIILSNVRGMHRTRRHSPPLVYPKVSVLVPARDEERNIARCVQSLMQQDYPDFEVLVLDDQSGDNTRAILDKMSISYPGLRLLDGVPPPGTQVGKNWACSQLARQAQGELILFTDADTFFQPETLRKIVTALLGEHADLLSGFPRQEVHTWGERLLVPFFAWSLLSFIPLKLAYRLRYPILSCALGQVMLFRRSAYQKVGGHDGVSSSIVEDMLLARRIKAAGLHWRMAYIADMVSCRMYRHSREAFNGFVKNLFAAFDFRLIPFTFVFIWLMVMFWQPLIVLLLLIIGHAPQARLDHLILCVGLSMMIWLIPYINLGVPFYLAFLYPLTILVNELAAFVSLRRSLLGQLSWKGRRIPRSRWKWI